MFLCVDIHGKKDEKSYSNDVTMLKEGVFFFNKLKRQGNQTKGSFI
jgi:hypothetical protein